MERARASHPTLKEETPVVQDLEIPAKEVTPSKQETQTNLGDAQAVHSKENQDLPQEEVVIRPFKSIPSSRLRKPRGGRRSWEI